MSNKKSKWNEPVEVPARIERQEIVTTRKATIHALLIAEAARIAGVGDDAGCDWFTDSEGNTYIAERWQVSSDPRVAALVNAAYIYTTGEFPELEQHAERAEDGDNA